MLYGPISDNAVVFQKNGRIAKKMLDKNDKSDAAGATTAAIGAFCHRISTYGFGTLRHLHRISRDQYQM